MLREHILRKINAFKPSVSTRTIQSGRLSTLWARRLRKREKTVTNGFRFLDAVFSRLNVRAGCTDLEFLVVFTIVYSGIKLHALGSTNLYRNWQPRRADACCARVTWYGTPTVENENFFFEAHSLRGKEKRSEWEGTCSSLVNWTKRIVIVNEKGYRWIRLNFRVVGDPDISRFQRTSTKNDSRFLVRRTVTEKLGMIYESDRSRLRTVGNARTGGLSFRLQRRMLLAYIC